MERTATSNATTVEAITIEATAIEDAGMVAGMAGGIEDGAAADAAVDNETVVVHVQLRPRRGASRKCLAALAALAAQHESASFAVSGVSKDDRVVKITVGVELGPRSAIAKFSPQAQAAYAFVSAIFTSLYDHMPVYTPEPSAAERKAAATLLEAAARGGVAAALPEAVLPSGTVTAELVPAQRAAGPAERISA